jgi:hypothetical protein
MYNYLDIKKVEVLEILIKMAKDRETTYYSKVMIDCHISRSKIGKILIKVAEYCYNNNEPILSSLVELKRGGIGKGYYCVVKQFNADRDYKKEQKKCFEYWRINYCQCKSDSTRPSAIHLNITSGASSA